MAGYRAWYADGSIHAWNAADLEGFLLGWVPRKVGVDDEDIEHVPATVAEVFGFLGETGSLPARQAALGRRARALTEEFALAARDPRRFGPAKESARRRGRTGSTCWIRPPLTPGSSVQRASAGGTTPHADGYRLTGASQWDGKAVKG
jgi:hypothetical protein